MGETAYTRDGTFGLAADGTIVTADGYIVQPGHSSSHQRHRRDGQYVGPGAGDDRRDRPRRRRVGQLQLAMFPNDAGLEAQGDNTYLQPQHPASRSPAIPPPRASAP